MILQCEIWEDISNKWHVGCVADLAHGSGRPHLLARGLDMSPHDFYVWVIKKYEPDIMFKAECDYGPAIFFRWTSEQKARKYKNDLNKLLRQKSIDLDLGNF